MSTLNFNLLSYAVSPESIPAHPELLKASHAFSKYKFSSSAVSSALLSLSLVWLVNISVMLLKRVFTLN